jgi:hypothetical protein
MLAKMNKDPYSDGRPKGLGALEALADLAMFSLSSHLLALDSQYSLAL